MKTKTNSANRLWELFVKDEKKEEWFKTPSGTIRKVVAKKNDKIVFLEYTLHSENPFDVSVKYVVEEVAQVDEDQ